MDNEIDHDEDNYYETETGETKMITPIETGTIVKCKLAYEQQEPRMVLGHIWWNCEQKIAYYLIPVDPVTFEPLEDRVPEYHWWQNDELEIVRSVELAQAA